MYNLVGTDGTRFFSFVLAPGRYLVGRKSECDFSIPHKTISRKHAEIVVGDDGQSIELSDLGSHNGTTVNGVRLTKCVTLSPGDAVMFGQTEFKVSAGDSAAERAAAHPRTIIADADLGKSVFLSINEALKPLPKKVTEKPELLPVLFDMAKMLVLTEPREAMLGRSLEMISKVIPTERLVVLFVSDDQESVEPVASLLPGGGNPGELSLSRTIINEIMTNKNAILISDPLADPRFAAQQSIIQSEMKSALAVPLFDQGDVLGILYADSTSPSHLYTDEHLRVMATFGNIIASRLVNYTLADERQLKAILDKELERASEIQKSLLVKDPPKLPGWDIFPFQEQSRQVGGDLYDIATLPDGKQLFLLADVSGKGMGAALLMSNILASFRILYESEPFDLQSVVGRVSANLFNYSVSSDFATLFAGIIDPSSNSICYINAGHNPPLLIRADGSMEYLEPSGIMIGAFDFAGWEEKTVKLEEGDMVFVFSDGVTEADCGEDQFGDERTEKLVVSLREKSAEQITSRLMSDINEFMGDSPRSDDITTLTVKRESK